MKYVIIIIVVLLLATMSILTSSVTSAAVWTGVLYVFGNDYPMQTFRDLAMIFIPLYTVLVIVYVIWKTSELWGDWISADTWDIFKPENSDSPYMGVRISAERNWFKIRVYMSVVYKPAEDGTRPEPLRATFTHWGADMFKVYTTYAELSFLAKVQKVEQAQKAEA